MEQPSGFDVAVKGPMALYAPASPAATAAAERVTEARGRYEGAREEVSRLNGHLERALRTEPGLRDPATAERFRAAFQAEHADAYEAEGIAARELAATLREAEPLIRADGSTVPNASNRIQILRGLDTLANSSEYAQAAELAGQYGAGADATLPLEHTQPIAERAALTGLREDLAGGVAGDEAVRRASGLLGAAGFASRTPALSAIGNAIGAGADISAFMRTGDPASLGAAGFGVLGAAAAATAVVASGPIAIGAGVVSGLALGGKFITRQIAGDNEYRAAVEAAVAQTHDLTPEQARELMGTDSRWLTASGLSSDELGALARRGHLHDAAQTFLQGFNEETRAYGDNPDYEAVQERARQLSEARPGMPYMAYQDQAFDEIQAEHRAAAGPPLEELRADLRRLGYLD